MLKKSWPLRRAAARFSTHARTPAQEHQFALYETLAARDASDKMLQTANSALTCHPRGPRRELPMPNRRKTDTDEPAFRRLIDDVATADGCNVPGVVSIVCPILSKSKVS